MTTKGLSEFEEYIKTESYRSIINKALDMFLRGRERNKRNYFGFIIRDTCTEESLTLARNISAKLPKDGGYVGRFEDFSRSRRKTLKHFQRDVFNSSFCCFFIFDPDYKLHITMDEGYQINLAECRGYESLETAPSIHNGKEYHQSSGVIRGRSSSVEHIEAMLEAFRLRS